MYDKKLKRSITLRISEEDFKFLSEVAADNSISFSCLIRSIITFYRDFARGVLF